MSDHNERACTNCGSLLHFADKCPDKPMREQTDLNLILDEIDASTQDNEKRLLVKALRRAMELINYAGKIYIDPGWSGACHEYITAILQPSSEPEEKEAALEEPGA